MCGGFTLLEVLLAFALLAVGLGLLVAIQSGGLRQVRQAALLSEAALHAQSLLDSQGVLEPLRPGSRQGEFADGRFRWQLDIAAVEDPVPLPAGAAPQPLGAVAPPVLYRLVLEVRGPAANSAPLLRLVSLKARMGQASP